MTEAMMSKTTMRDDLLDWLRFIRGESHMLRERMQILFQQAANQPGVTSPARGDGDPTNRLQDH